MIATTKEQSARLLQCGVPAKTADMCLSTRTRKSDGSFVAKKHQTTNLWVGYPCWRTTSGDEELENVPAWSLSRLMELLPKANKDERQTQSNMENPPLKILLLHRPCWRQLYIQLRNRQSAERRFACFRQSGYNVHRTGHADRSLKKIPRQNGEQIPQSSFYR